MTGIDAHISSAHMVLSRDLNPHDTLFAGQGTSYMIECAFLAVQSFLRTPHIVCLGLDGLRFLHPVHKGDTIRVDSSIVYAGTSGIGGAGCPPRCDAGGTSTGDGPPAEAVSGI